MSEISRSFKIQKSSDDRSCPSEDNKRRIRKMIEVTSSTRYMTFVEGDDVPNDGMALVPRRRPVNHNFSTTMVVIDSSLGNLQDAIGGERVRFGSRCRKMAQQYVERIQEMNGKMEKCAKMMVKYRKMDGQLKDQKRNTVKELQGVLKNSQKKREEREKILSGLLKKMA
ncbi:hypothetical protein RP20_CCG016674 [Aedes albopictus]|nr:hypothetical protein RP20_CCG016674 [Aedes albopictus]